MSSARAEALIQKRIDADARNVGAGQRCLISQLPTLSRASWCITR